MQYHASLIAADGAYHCPVGSIMAIFIAIRPTKGQCKEQPNENEASDVPLRKKPVQLLSNVEIQDLKVSLGLKLLYNIL